MVKIGQNGEHEGKRLIENERILFIFLYLDTYDNVFKIVFWKKKKILVQQNILNLHTCTDTDSISRVKQLIRQGGHILFSYLHSIYLPPVCCPSPPLYYSVRPPPLCSVRSSKDLKCLRFDVIKFCRVKNFVWIVLLELAKLHYFWILINSAYHKLL